MASSAGIVDTTLVPLPINAARHNPQTSTPGLPVIAATVIYQGCMVAWDTANSQARPADPAMPATSIMMGVAQETVDNSAGAKGDKKITPEFGLFRIDNDGNVTAAHIGTLLRVIDDHTVGVPAGTSADRIAGLCMGLEGGYVWVYISPDNARRSPVEVTLTSTNGTAAGAADLAALKAEAEKIGDDVRALHAALVLLRGVAPAA